MLYTIYKLLNTLVRLTDYHYSSCNLLQSRLVAPYSLELYFTLICFNKLSVVWVRHWAFVVSWSNWYDWPSFVKIIMTFHCTIGSTIIWINKFFWFYWLHFYVYYVSQYLLSTIKYPRATCITNILKIHEPELYFHSFYFLCLNYRLYWLLCYTSSSLY